MAAITPSEFKLGQARRKLLALERTYNRLIEEPDYVGRSVRLRSVTSDIKHWQVIYKMLNNGVGFELDLKTTKENKQ